MRPVRFETEKPNRHWKNQTEPTFFLNRTIFVFSFFFIFLFFSKTGYRIFNLFFIFKIVFLILYGRSSFPFLLAYKLLFDLFLTENETAVLGWKNRTDSQISSTVA